MPCVRLARNMMRAGKPAGRASPSRGCGGRLAASGVFFPWAVPPVEQGFEAAGFLRETLFRVGSVSAPCHKWSKLDGKGPVLISAPLGARALRCGPPSLPLRRHLRLEQRQGLWSRIRRWLRIACAAPASPCI